MYEKLPRSETLAGPQVQALVARRHTSPGRILNADQKERLRLLPETVNDES